MISGDCVAVQQQHLAQLRTENETLQSRLSDSQTEIQSLKSQLEWFKRQLFGRKSEKRLPIDPAIQGDLLAEHADAPGEPPPAPPRQLRDPQVCAPGDQAWGYWGAGERPGTGQCIREQCGGCQLPRRMLVDKFVYHLPLYRQHQRLSQCGIDLARATLTSLARRSIDLVSPVFEAQLGHILDSRVLAMDETPIKAGRAAKGKLRQGYLWPVYGEADEIAFSYTASHAGTHVSEILGERFRGVLVCDGYAAYARYAGQRTAVTHAECWAHTRRYFERAQDTEPGCGGTSSGAHRGAVPPRAIYP